MSNRKAAARPAPRTQTVTLGDDSRFPGWSATFRLDFPARLAIELESGRLEPVLAVLEAIITEHNMPDSEGNIAEHLADVDPYNGLLAVSNALTEALTSVPPA